LLTSPARKVAVLTRQQGRGPINQASGIIFRQEQEPNKPSRASGQAALGSEAKAGVSSSGLCTSPFGRGRRGADPDHRPTPRAPGWSAPQRGKEKVIPATWGSVRKDLQLGVSPPRWGGLQAACPGPKPSRPPYCTPGFALLAGCFPHSEAPR
jgi:hypothetical protein